MRTVDGDCCIFPFKYNGRVYNNCTKDGGSAKPWCAVKLPFSGTEKNWRKTCIGKRPYNEIYNEELVFFLRQNTSWIYRCGFILVSLKRLTLWWRLLFI